MSWVDYWNGKPTIYVSDRHRDAHDFDIAFSIVRLLATTNAHVLDFGCGEATRARYIASRCSRLYLWDAASSVRDRLRRRFGTVNSIVVPEGTADLADGTIDLIVVSSVVQYMSEHDLAVAFDEFKRLLTPVGRLVVADVIPPSVSIVHDAWQLFRFARQERFLAAAVVGLVRTATSSYLFTRSKTRLTKFNEQEFLTLLQTHGFAGRRLERNFGHNRHRMAFEAHPSPQRIPRVHSDADLEHSI